MNFGMILAVDPIVLTAWWVWLVVALVVTLVDVALLVRVIRAVNRIASLTARTLPSAKNIATHTKFPFSSAAQVGSLPAA